MNKGRAHSKISLLFCLCISFSLSAQLHKVDSLTKVISTSSILIDKANAYVTLADELYVNNIDTVIPLCEAALKLLEVKTTDNESSYLKREIIRAKALNNIGTVYNNYGNQPQALSYYFQSLKIREEIKDDKGKVESFTNIGLIYKAEKDTANALKYYRDGLKIAQKIKDALGEATILNNIAAIYKNDTASVGLALKYYAQSMEVLIKINNLYEIGKVQHNIAVVYHDLGKYDVAREYYGKSIKAKEECGDKRGLMNSFNALANLEIEQGKMGEAELLAKKSLEIAEELELTFGIVQSSETLYEIYSSQNKWKEALHMHELYSEYKDLQLEESNSIETTQMQMQFEFDKKLASDSLKAVEEQKLIAERFKSEKVQRYALYGGLTLVAVFALFIFNRFRVTQKQKHIIEIKEQETQKQKHIIEEKHKEITDSINYAERIQRSFLATKEILDENLKEYFVLFKPKDVVSGDFYWAAPLSLSSGGGKGETKFALVTADSTGHGVPGAIMSLLNITSIEGAIKDRFIEPSDILNATRKTIIERLKKDGSFEGGKDGMDASLCVYDFKNKKLTIAAANNPVWIVRYEEGSVAPSVVEVKPDKMPIGKHDKDSISFTQQEIDLQAGDVIYTLTDGFPDQFGGPNGKKFMSKNLRELLAANAHLPMQQQKTLLEKTFSDWVGNMEQVDDVCIIGIRL